MNDNNFPWYVYVLMAPHILCAAVKRLFVRKRDLYQDYQDKDPMSEKEISDLRAADGEAHTSNRG